MATNTEKAQAQAQPVSPQAAAEASPDENTRATKLVRTNWPVMRFVVQGLPEIKREGTLLTATQLDKAKDAAKKQNVRLAVEDVK